MKKQWKGFALGVVITLLIVSLVGSAFAAYQKQATLEYADIKLVINGNAITPTDANGNAVEPFIIDGTTYLPIRAIANALGLDVAWDNSTKTATLTTPNAIKKGSILYDDENVTIAFDSISQENSLFYKSKITFMVTNKTDLELTFQSNSMSFDGISYLVGIGSDEVSPHSTGKIHFGTDEVVLENPTTTTGAISVIDFSGVMKTYEAKWTGNSIGE